MVSIDMCHDSQALRNAQAEAWASSGRGALCNHFHVRNEPDTDGGPSRLSRLWRSWNAGPRSACRRRGWISERAMDGGWHF